MVISIFKYWNNELFRITVKILFSVIQKKKKRNDFGWKMYNEKETVVQSEK